jgi:hypothetical protein
VACATGQRFEYPLNFTILVSKIWGSPQFTLEPLGMSTRFGLEFEIQASGLAGLIGDLIIRLTLKQVLKTFKTLVETGGMT